MECVLHNSQMRKAKIVATIGPATDSGDQICRLVAAGVDVARINMSHGERMHHVEVVARIRKAAAAADRPVAVLADLCGPKIRTGKLGGGGPVRLESGAQLGLVSDVIEGTAERVTVSYAALGREVSAGARILLDDGLIELRVVSAREGEVVAEVINGGSLGERKGVNIPGVRLSIPSVTEKDIADLEAILEAGVDYVALSFVREAEDCRRARALIDARAAGVRLIAKIEKPEAVDAIDEILEVVDGIMVARGDLGVETSPESVPVIQKMLIARAVERERMVITATQMLQSMIDNPRPTRAEASDVANAILDGTDAVMLSGETAIGSYPVETVATMDRIIRTTEESRPTDYEAFAERMAATRSGSIGRAVAKAAVFAAHEVSSRYLVVFSQTGRMVRHVASLRPPQRILALTPSLDVSRLLAGVWGVEPNVLEQPGSADALLRSIDLKLVELGGVSGGEIVVTLVGSIAAGDVDVNPAAHVLKMHRIGERT